MTKADKVVPAALANAYPADPAPVPDTKELDAVKADLEKVKSEAEELKTQNKELNKQLEVLQKEKKVALAEQVADIKVERGLLKEDEKKAAMEKLSEFSEETLNILKAELSSVQIKLSDPKPAPTATPVADPVTNEPTPEEKHETQVKEMRMKLFGHDNDSYEFYNAQKKVI